MSFQHFRLGDIALHHLKKQAQQSPQQQQAPSQPKPHTKQPYGSGDADDGYTLAFANLQEFNEWRQAEEERTMCEFVKVCIASSLTSDIEIQVLYQGDTHGSKAVPPRFKDHTKLVCARHSRSGRKKYIKKHPERVRKVPSRKLEVGCPASISYKTYFDSEQVRACYVSQHSHEVGLANLPFTRRGRREAAATKTEKDKTKPTSTQVSENTVVSGTTSVPSAAVATNATNEQSVAPSANVSPQPAASVPPSASTSFSTAVSMLAPLPPQGAYPVSPPQTYSYTTPAPPPPPQLAYPPVPPAHPAPAPPLQPLIPTPTATSLANDRWENMATLFQSIREHARSFEYPGPSVAALETILIRLYLESPVGMNMQTTGMSSMMPAIMAHARNVANPSASVQEGSSSVVGSSNDVTGGSTGTEDHA
ncbi:hypothetical protein AN958_06608 [Leucoagaricus sp. SymC.cos]|nr:hypothetical protein AN958_06608 [Leucoagaricus sp. SymC.cos]